MKKEEIESIKEALKASPDNIPLRILLGQKYFEKSAFEEAEACFQTVLSIDPNNIRAKENLAEIYFVRKNYSAVIIIVEELIQRKKVTERMLHIYAKALVRENSIEQAQEVYEQLLDHNPDFEDEELDAKLRMPSFDFGQDKNEDDDFFDDDFTFGVPFDDEMEEDQLFLEKPNINFNDVGGLDDLKEEISRKIIKPIEYEALFKKYGKKIGGGILMYGPPGCGKTYLAKATAGEIEASFLSIGINDILDMWIGRSEHNLNNVFEIARENRPCVMFFDEVDALGASRHDMRSSSGRHVINQFLSEMDNIASSNEGILIIGASNAPWHIDTAFKRPGRFDKLIFVPPPDHKARVEIFKIHLKDRWHEDIDYQKIANLTKIYSGADIKHIVELAVDALLDEVIKNNKERPLNTNDIEKAIARHLPTTKEWFNVAKNYALYANQSGIYNDVLKYIKDEL